MTEFTCQHCGTRFWSYHRRKGIPQKFCGKACYDAAQTRFQLEPIACKGCGTMFVPPRDNRGQVYCTVECRIRFKHLGALRVCRQCGKTFKPAHPDLRDGNPCCSMECVWAAKRTRQAVKCQRCGKVFRNRKTEGSKYCSQECRWPNRPTSKTCLQCGKVFRRKNRSHYCSKACQVEASKDQVPITCRQCGTVFSVIRKREATAKYCSRACKWALRAAARPETTIERAVRQSLERLRIEFKQEKWIDGRYCLDFYLPAFNVAVEADGDYWHRDRDDYDSERDAYILERHGIETIRLKEREIRKAKDLDALITKRLGLKFKQVALPGIG